MTSDSFQNMDDFFSGHLIVSKNRNILFCNSYICELCEQSKESLVGTSISNYISKASNIFIDSYIYPLLINESIAKEIQITWIAGNGEKVPVVANVKLGANGTSYWSVYVCIVRDKLQSELLKANEKLENLSQELFILATTDPLTGLLNRRELQDQVSKVIYQSSRNASTFALLTVDVDFFKKVNDTYGHKVGDNVLKELANLLKYGLRENDLTARFGGEEFVVVLQDVDENQAFLVSEKMRENIENTLIDNIKVTVSIGLVVTRKDDAVSFDSLLKLSDDALYKAKELGRNRSIIADY